MDTLINTASTTFEANTGFGLSAVVDFVVEQALVVLGFGLYIVTALLPIILIFAAISAGIYLLYRVLKWVHIL